VTTTERAVAVSLLMHSVLPSWKSAVERGVSCFFAGNPEIFSASGEAGISTPCKYIATLSEALRIF
jgi:hypothetical protein